MVESAVAGTSELRFDDRVALVTGAGRGLGREYALALGSRGARIVVNDIDPEPAESVVAEIKALGGDAVASTDSVTTAAGAQAMVALAVSHFETLDIVVNNAGTVRDRRFHRMTEDDLDAMVDVHLRGAFNVARAAWEPFCTANFGRIVSTTSTAGIFGNAGHTNYGAAKAGVVGLTRVLALEGQRHGITVNAIAPLAKTRLLDYSLARGASSATGVAHRLSNRLHPRLVAPLVTWLCHEACTVTGETVAVGGGRVARIILGETDGYYDPALSAESVRDHWAEICDAHTHRMLVPRHIGDEMAAFAAVIFEGED